MELAHKMDSLADTVACMQRQADQVTQTIMSVNTAIYEIVQGGNGEYDKLRDTLNDLTLELRHITQCAEDAEDANQALSEAAVERAASKVDTLDCGDDTATNAAGPSHKYTWSFS
eukprot:587942-Prymnesium_polylepis.1